MFWQLKHRGNMIESRTIKIINLSSTVTRSGSNKGKCTKGLVSFTQGRVRLPNQINFRKNSIQPSIPPSFSENYFAIFLWQIWVHICEKVWWPDSMKCMHMISRDRDHSEGWGVGVNCCLEPFRKFIRFGCVTHPSEKFLQRGTSSIEIW